MSFLSDEDRAARQRATNDIDAHNRLVKNQAYTMARACLPKVQEVVRKAYREGRDHASFREKVDMHDLPAALHGYDAVVASAMKDELSRLVKSELGLRARHASSSFDEGTYRHYVSVYIDLPA